MDRTTGKPAWSVVGVASPSPSGLRVGDSIAAITVNGRTFATVASLVDMAQEMSAAHVGDKADIQVRRGGQVATIQVPLLAMPQAGGGVVGGTAGMGGRPTGR